MCAAFSKESRMTFANANQTPQEIRFDRISCYVALTSVHVCGFQ
jgi:hypothetical protein